MFVCCLLVLKSDNANGLFGLKSISPIVVTESTNVTVIIERSKGRFGSATVFWSVFKISTSVLASDDFIMASGSVDFAESENEKVGKERERDIFSKRNIVWTKICRV